MYYNFVRVHSTLRVTPAMEAGLSEHVWSIEELCSLLPQAESAAKRIDMEIILKALGEQSQHEVTPAHIHYRNYVGVRHMGMVACLQDECICRVGKKKLREEQAYEGLAVFTSRLEAVVSSLRALRRSLVLGRGFSLSYRPLP